MSTPRCPLHPRLRKILDDSGCGWSCVRGKRHWRLVIEGDVVLSFPTGCRDTSGGRHWENALACVRRAVRGLSGAAPRG